MYGIKQLRPRKGKSEEKAQKICKSDMEKKRKEKERQRQREEVERKLSHALLSFLQLSKTDELDLRRNRQTERCLRNLIKRETPPTHDQ